MSLLFHTTGLVDQVADAAAASRPSGVFFNVLRFSDSEDDRQASDVAGRRMPEHDCL